MFLRICDEKFRVERKICQSHPSFWFMLMTKKIVSLNSRIILLKRLGILSLRMNVHSYTSLMEFVPYNTAPPQKIT